MQYISSFIHVPGESARTVAIDVTKIDNISGRDNEVKVYTTGSGRYMEVKMPKQKFIDLVEDKRRELWEAKYSAESEQIQLLRDIVKYLSPEEKAKRLKEAFSERINYRQMLSDAANPLSDTNKF